MARGKQDPARAKAVNSSYSEASAALIANHKDEFNRLRATILREKHGVEWAPPLTQEQRDEKALREILDRNPVLASQVAREVEPKTGPPTADPHS